MSHLGNYDIGDVICLGDAGSCYRVHNVGIGRNAAATILYTYNGAGTNLIQQKLENAIELSHPAIVTPTRIDTLSDGNLYVIYEHFADALLAQRSKDERFRKPNFALNFIRQIAEALETRRAAAGNPSQCVTRSYLAEDATGWQFCAGDS